MSFSLPRPECLQPPNPELAHSFWLDLKGASPYVVQKIERLGVLEEVLFILGSGSYLGGQLSRNPEWLDEFMLQKGGLSSPAYPELFSHLPSGEDKALEEIRRIKLKEHLRIGVKDLLWAAPIEEVLADLSALADAVIEAMLKVVWSRCVRIYGEPLSQEGEPVQFSVVGLGKLGGYELNYNSDVDLIYVYGTEKGETTGPRVVKNHQFFVRLAELLTGYLSAMTEVGQCYKVDLRLRPDGTRGEITLPLLSYEIYYESYGREWERAMLVKARHVAGDEVLTQSFLEALRPFVYRRYLDSSVIDSMRQMKMRIDAEMCKRGSEYDVKLGRGGIREIEFVVNAIQLLNGGRHPELRVQGTMKALEVINKLNLLPDNECQVLSSAYRFLRRVENRLQMVNCLQTHKLPEDPEDRERIARMMGEFSSLERFDEVFSLHTSGVYEVYSHFFRQEGEEVACSILNPEDLEATLEAKGFLQPSSSAAVVKRLFLEDSTHLGAEQGVAIAQQVIDLAADTPDPDGALEGLERIAQAWSDSLTTFYSLLAENRGLVELLLKIFGTSRYLTNVLVLNPGVMDYLEEPDFVEMVLSVEELVEEIWYIWELEGAHTLEERAEKLREGILRELLRIGVGHLFHQKGVEWVTQRWTVLAQSVLSSLVDFVVGEGLISQPVGVMGLGKLGSKELIYHSDLDLIFLTADEPSSTSQKGISTLVKTLGEQTTRGRLFEVDLRLRPYGDQGMLVTSLKTLETYLKKHAQLWEFQALTRARGVAGDDEICSRALKIIHAAIYREFPPEDMAKRVADMRLRMERELSKGSPYHLKYSPGGLVDVEFLVQYLRLLHGHGFVELRTAASSFEVLEVLRRLDLLNHQDYHTLVGGYRFLRVAEMWLRILFDVPVSRLPEDPRRRLILAKAMGFSDEAELLKEYAAHTSKIRDTFKKVLGLS